MIGLITSRLSKVPSENVWKISRRRGASIQHKGAQRVGACEGADRRGATAVEANVLTKDALRRVAINVAPGKRDDDA